MPIDLLWIRHHPDQVQDWQRCRGLEVSKVSQVVAEDQASRELLHSLRLRRERLNVLAKELRLNRDDAALLKERQELQFFIKEREQELTTKQQDLQKIVATLGSPVDQTILNQFKPAIDSKTSFDQESTCDWLVTRSILHAALLFFGRKYSALQNLGGLEQTTTTTIQVSSIGGTRSPAPWLVWMSQTIPRKAIFGAKQVPRYTLLKHKEQLELLAMTAGTMWDSRQVQLELAHEVVAFFQSQLATKTMATPLDIQMHATPALELELHEISRIVITANQRTFAWVSNFGDAASRACDLRFKGGGLSESKEFVHWVHATIVGPWTMANLDSCNVRMHACLEVEAHRRSTDSVLAPPRLSTRLVGTNHSTKRMNLVKFNKSAEAVSCPFGFLISS